VDSNVEVLESSASFCKRRDEGGSGKGSSKIIGQLDRGLMQVGGNERQELRRRLRAKTRCALCTAVGRR